MTQACVTLENVTALVWLAGFGLDERQRGGMHAPRNALRGLNIDISIGGPTATPSRSPARATETCCGADILASLVEKRGVFTSAGFIGSGPPLQALARYLLAARMPVLTGNSRGPHSGTERVAQLNDDARAVTLEQAAKADVVILAAAVPAGN
jgi:hypothetical protein